jgi:LysM repeat protein
MSLTELRGLNDIPAGSSRIHPGQRLVVASRQETARQTNRPERPDRAERTAAAAPSDQSDKSERGRTYTVRSGDTLGTIADAHRIGLTTLRRLNGMGSRTTRIYPGQTLVVGESAEAVEVADASESIAYRIRRGDTLTTIARKFGVSVEELQRWNRVDPDRLVVGQSIKIRGSGGGQ